MLKILYIHIIDCRPFVTKFTTVTVIRNIPSKVHFLILLLKKSLVDLHDYILSLPKINKLKWSQIMRYFAAKKWNNLINDIRTIVGTN